MDKTWTKNIEQYIEEYTESQYDELLSTNSDFDIFYHLSEGRKGILSWYDFDADASVLEIGGGYGALTSLFCEKCRKVTVTERDAKRAELIKKRLREYDNVTVLTGDFFAALVQEKVIQEKYDYIIIMGLLELQSEPVQYLRDLKKYLSTKGKILLAVDNPYGAHFLAGGTHPTGSGVPFVSLNGWNRCKFTKEKLIGIVKRAGFEGWKLYYPLPDYHFTQVVYSDEYLPQTKISERIQTYYRDNSTLIANEKRILDDAVKNGAFPFVANSFLVECSLNEEVSRVNYAAITLERNNEQSCATKIYGDYSVSKEAIHPEGLSNMKRIAENINDLQRHGLCVVPCQLEDNKLRMPFYNAPLLSSVLDDFIADGKEVFTELFDRLYENILQSSEIVDDRENVLLTEDNHDWNWGPILQNCYFEMIPMNCFYDHGKFIYFDQEFVREKFPAKYTLYRALRNTYIFNKNVQQCVSLDEMKKHYNMEQIWDTLERVDDAFLADIRKKNNPLSGWTRIDYEKIKKNQQFLQNK